MRRNLDISMWILIALLAFTSIRTGAFSDPMGWLMDKLLLLPGIVLGLSMHEYAPVSYTHLTLPTIRLV